MTADFDALAAALGERVTALGEAASPETIRNLVKSSFEDLLGDAEVIRKIRFGSDSAPELVGTKYQRWGLGVDDVEFLFDIMSTAKGSRINGEVHPGPSEELTRTFSAISSARYLSPDQIRDADLKSIDETFLRLPKSSFLGADRDLAERGAYELTGAYQRAIRAMDTGESGFGSQLVGAQYVGALWDAPRRDSRIFNQIPSFEMTDPTAYLPVEVDFPKMLFVPESTTFNATNYATVKTGSQRVQVDAKKFVIHQIWSGEMDEDSIIPYVPFLRAQAAKGLAHYLDALVLNGDTTNSATGNINLDDADPADDEYYLAFDGIRHAGLVDNTANKADAAGAVTLALLAAQRGRMIDATRFVDWGHPTDKDDLLYVADPATADAIAQLTEVVTVDKFGPNATVHNGQVARVLGHPLIGSMACSKTEADGKVSTTGANNTKGQVVAFNKRGIVAGWRRQVQTKVQELPGTDQTRIVHSLRLGAGRFTPTGAASGLEFADVLYNITL